jgi:hypothetical protein
MTVSFMTVSLMLDLSQVISRKGLGRKTDLAGALLQRDQQARAREVMGASFFAWAALARS